MLFFTVNLQKCDKSYLLYRSQKNLCTQFGSNFDFALNIICITFKNNKSLKLVIWETAAQSDHNNQPC